jgi:fructose-bisphosphate aldolase class I
MHTSNILVCVDTQNAIVAPGKGILAADESIPTIGRRFAAIGVANTPENRIKYGYVMCVHL